MKTFAEMPYDNDILVRIIVKKSAARFAYQSVRPAKTDFPTLTCAAGYDPEACGEKFRIVIGARPNRAMIVEDQEQILADGLNEDSIRRFAEYAQKQVPTGSNMRGSAAYRTHLVKVLVTRVLSKLGGEDVC